MAPALAAIGLNSRLMDAGVLERTMSTPVERLGANGSTVYFFSAKCQRFAGAVFRCQELDRPTGKLALFQDDAHQFADRSRRADNCHTRIHENILSERIIDALIPFLVNANSMSDK